MQLINYRNRTEIGFETLLLVVLGFANIITISYVNSEIWIFILSTCYLGLWYLFSKWDNIDKRNMLLAVILTGIICSLGEYSIIQLSIRKTLNYMNDLIPLWLISAGYGPMILWGIHIYKIIQTK
jgi:hypothetical protein